MNNRPNCAHVGRRFSESPAFHGKLQPVMLDFGSSSLQPRTLRHAIVSGCEWRGRVAVEGEHEYASSRGRRAAWLCAALGPNSRIRACRRGLDAKRRTPTPVQESPQDFRPPLAVMSLRETVWRRQPGPLADCTLTPSSPPPPATPSASQENQGRLSILVVQRSQERPRFLARR
jgi:hypothetical protein